MNYFTSEEIKNMDLNKAKNELSNAVYQATFLIEMLESVGKVRGNGHHIRQKLAKMVEDFLGERWINEN